MQKGEGKRLDNNLKVTEKEENQERSEHPLSYSKLIADVESDEKNEESEARLQGTQQRHFDSYNHCFPIDEPNHLGRFSGPAQVNYHFKVPLDEKLKKSQALKNDSQDLMTVGTPPVSTKDTLGFGGLMRHHSNSDGQFNGFQERGSGVPKKLGGKIISSVLMRVEVKSQEELIDEESQILSEAEQNSSISHFEPVKFDDSEDLESETQELRTAEGIQYVIKTSSIKVENEDQFQQRAKNQDSPIELKEDSKSLSLIKNQYPPLPKHSNSNKQQNKLSMIKEQSSNPSLAVKSDETNKEHMLYSKIIKRNSIDLPEKNKKEQPRGRMMYTGNPKIKDSQYAAAANHGNLSEPNRRTEVISKKSQNDFEDVQSQKNKASDSNQQNSSKVILQKLMKIEKAMLMLQEKQEKAAQQDPQKKLKPVNSAKSTQKKEIEKKPSHRKIEAMHRIVPEELLEDNLSSIQEKDENLNDLFKRDKNHRGNINFQQEIKKLQNKVMELQKIQSGKQSKSGNKGKLIRAASSERSLRDKIGIAINFRDYNQTSLGRMVNRQLPANLRTQESSDRTLQDEDFIQLQRRMPSFDRYPKPEDSQNKIAGLGIQVFDTFGLKVEKYGEMDVCLTREGVQYELSRGPSLIWEYTGRLYFGETRERRGILQKEGKGIEICPNKSIYQGDFRKNGKNGYGIIINFSSQQKYKGFWKDNLYDGRGKLVSKYSRYDGYFVKGAQQGEGFELFLNEDTYEGEYVNGKFQGRGKYIWKKNNNYYEGQFNRGYLEGDGIWRGSNGDSYEGQYYKSMKHGYGIYRWRNGKVFQGKFEHGHRVNHRSPDRRIISPERQITYDLNETSELIDLRADVNRSGNKKKFTVRNFQQPTNQRKSSFHFFPN